MHCRSLPSILGDLALPFLHVGSLEITLTVSFKRENFRDLARFIFAMSTMTETL